MRAPSASSRSAEPERLVAERLPCLATAQPAPAAIRAAVVETLNVLRPPPGAGRVEQVLALARHVGGELAHRPREARPAPATVSPFVRSAIRKAGDLDLGDLAVHDLGQHLGGLPRCSRSRREARASIAAVSVGFGTASVGARRKLASSSWPCSVRTDSGWNWTPSAGSSRWRSAISTPPPRADSSRQSGSSLVDDERVVAPDRQRRAQAAEDRAAVVLDRRGLAVDRLRAA